MSGFTWVSLNLSPLAGRGRRNTYFGRSLWQDFGAERQSSQMKPHREQPPSARPRVMTAMAIDILFMSRNMPVFRPMG